MPHGERSDWRILVCLLAILALAAGFRVVGLDWDQGTHQHPDERHISQVMLDRLTVPPRKGLETLLDPAISELNVRSADPNSQQPRQYAYGTLPVLITDAVACALDTISGRNCALETTEEERQRPNARPYWTAYQYEHLVGRVLTILADLALIVVTFALGRRAFGSIAGLVAAAFLAVSVVNIQLAHFFATDTWLTLFNTATLWALYRAADKGPFASWRDWSLAGILAAATIASKPTPPVIGLAALVALWYSVRGEASDGPRLFVQRGLIAGLSSLMAFALFEPYALPTIRVYLRDINEQAEILGSGIREVPYTLQFVGTQPVIHYLWNLWGYGLGPGLTLLALLGLVASAWRAWRLRRPIDLMLVVWLLAYSVVINTVLAKFLRYTLPLVPILALMGGALVSHHWHILQERSATAVRSWRLATRGRQLAAFGVSLALVAGLIQAATFVTIYFQPHTRVAASNWIYDNVPRGARIAGETWDDGLPLGLPEGRNGFMFNYQRVDAKHYDDRPSEPALQEIERLLNESDYIVLASQRVYGSTERLPWRYPVVNRYYDLLFAGRLGFDLVYENTLQPRLGPFHLDSRWADESFSVYDHPPVHIFRKSASLSSAHLRSLFSEAMARQPEATRKPPKDRPLLLNEPLWTWPDLSQEAWAAPAGSSWSALSLWLIALLTLTLVGLPWTLLLCRPLADGGSGMARPFALMLVGYLAWIGASLRLVPFTSLSVVVIAGLVGVIGWLWLWRRPHLLGELRSQLPAIAVTEGIFWVGFASSLGLRLANPDVWQPWLGGEKPMETAFLNAVLRSAYFPPFDPWFGGGYINYYYFGFVLVAIPIKLSGVAPMIAFNLAIATLFGMVAAGAASIGQTLARSLAGRERPPGARLVGAIGLLASVLTVGVGNLDGAVQLYERWRGTMPDFDFWRSSRAMQFVITEFPYFSFLFADLHAHLIAMPLAILVIGLALVNVISPKPSTDEQGAARLIGLGRWLAAALCLGGLAGTNAWDVPAYTGLLAGSAFLTAPFARRQVFQRAIWAGGVALLVGGLAYLLFLPFFQNFQSFYGSIGLTRIPARLHEFLTIWGYFVGLVLLLVSALLWALVRDGRLRRLHWSIIGLTIVAALAAGAAIPRGLPAPAILFPVIALLVLIWLTNGLAPAGEFTLVMLIGGLSIIVGVEFIFIVDFLQGGEWYRMNTVFKLYLEAWLLLALGLAGGAALMVREWRRLADTFKGIAVTFATLGLVAVLVYPVMVTPDRLRKRFDQTPGPTLNGLAYMEVGELRNGRNEPVRFDEDLAAIEWMQRNLRGAPIVAEAMIGPYRGNGSRITNSTGFPTVLGWDNHEAQQRWPDSIPPRARAVRQLYTSRTPAEALGLIERFDIDYILVGQVERRHTLPNNVLGATREHEYYASPDGLATLEQLAKQGQLRPVFSQGETTIYQVVRPLIYPGDRAADRPGASEWRRG